jgi:hypothetical protein
MDIASDGSNLCRVDDPDDVLRMMIQFRDASSPLRARVGYGFVGVHRARTDGVSALHAKKYIAMTTAARPQVARRLSQHINLPESTTPQAIGQLR